MRVSPFWNCPTTTGIMIFGAGALHSAASSYVALQAHREKALVEESYLGLQFGHNLSKDNPDKPYDSRYI